MHGQIKYGAKEFNREWSRVKHLYNAQRDLGWHSFIEQNMHVLLSDQAMSFILSEQKEVFFGEWLIKAAYNQAFTHNLEKVLTGG